MSIFYFAPPCPLYQSPHYERSLAKFEIPKVKVSGPITSRDALLEIFKRKPHVSAATAAGLIAAHPLFVYDMVTKYNINEERCKRLWSSWSKVDPTTVEVKRNSKLVSGWDQWTLHRLRIFAQLLSVKGPNYQYAQQNKATIRKILPTWTKELENKLQSMGKDQCLDIEDSPDDLLSDGEPEQNNNRGVEHDSLPETDLDDESTLAEVIALMAPPPEPQKRPKRRITDKRKKIKTKSESSKRK